jgi:chromatin segregation and condensation protein Rec8/ScpA/Scc1 (kleisin family)
MASCLRMANPQADRATSQLAASGPQNILRRVRDIVEHGRVDVTQLRIGSLVGWLLGRARVSDTVPTLGELCIVLEGAARLVLLKARRLAGSWEPAPEEVIEPWAGLSAELPLRRSWLAERVAAGPLSYPAPVRAHEHDAPLLASIAPDRLRQVMLIVQARVKPPRLRVVPLPRLVRASVEACCALVLEHIGHRRQLSFAEVALDGRDGQVAVFLACLILARQGRVELQQDDLFGDIVIRPGELAFEATA